MRAREPATRCARWRSDDARAPRWGGDDVRRPAGVGTGAGEPRAARRTPGQPPPSRGVLSEVGGSVPGVPDPDAPPPGDMSSADRVTLTDLEVITRYSLALRTATADRAELVRVLRDDLEWLTAPESEPAPGSRPPAPAVEPSPGPRPPAPRKRAASARRPAR